MLDLLRGLNKSRIAGSAAIWVLLLSLIFISVIVYKRDATNSAAQKIGFDHVLRIRISVEFDGEPLEFDDLLYCTGRTKSDAAGSRTQVLSRRLIISRPTRDGGLLAYIHSWRYCSPLASQWRPGKDPKKEFSAPDGFIPVFRWVDSAVPEDQSIGEAYISETYPELFIGVNAFRVFASDGPA